MFTKIAARTGFRSRFHLNVRGYGSKKPASFGICFDIDGVIARGHVPLKNAADAFSLIKRENNLILPVTFVTNGMALHQKKAEQLSSWVKTQISQEQVICSQSPLQCYDSYKDRHCLLIGQGPLKAIAAELGFHNTCIVEELSKAYPLLDVALFAKKEKINRLLRSGSYAITINSHLESVADTDFPPVEAIIILGEPAHWETPLQLVIDLLLTHGKPDSHSVRVHEQTLPVIACNKDFQYVHRAKHPRFGNGTFLLCLESIFKKLIGYELKYAALIGKPSECTLRFAENQLSEQLHTLYPKQRLRTLYMVGDNVNSDIVAANLYQHFIDVTRKASALEAEQNEDCDMIVHHNLPNALSDHIPPSRQLPVNHPLRKQTVKKVTSVLVRTGVFTEDIDHSDLDHSHKDFDMDGHPELMIPSVIQDNVFEAVKYILEKENFTSG